MYDKNMQNGILVTDFDGKKKQIIGGVKKSFTQTFDNGIFMLKQFIISFCVASFAYLS